MAIAAWVAVVVVGSCSIGCGHDNFGNPKHVIDSTGTVFAWTCEADGCAADPDDGLVVTCGGRPNNGYMYSYSRFVSICPAYGRGGLSGTFGELCRLVACTTSSECPQFDGSRYACENGLCQRIGHDGTIHSDDLLELCLDASERASDCSDARTDPEVVAAYDAVEAQCGTEVDATCASVPAWCRQP